MVKVKELIELLKSFPPDAEVKTTWENIVNELDADEVYMSADGVLLIDADANSYKEHFVSGLNKAA